MNRYFVFFLNSTRSLLGGLKFLKSKKNLQYEVGDSIIFLKPLRARTTDEILFDKGEIHKIVSIKKNYIEVAKELYNYPGQLISMEFSRNNTFTLYLENTRPGRWLFR